MLERRHFIGLALLYALGIVYASLVLGPLGVHFVPMTTAEAWAKFVAIRFVQHDADQRPDWIANLVMLTPLGYVIQAALHQRYSRHGPVMDLILALWLCLLFILGVKFAQLYFPPRTVSLNYVVAQSLGAVLGIYLFRISHAHVYPAVRRMTENGEGLAVLLGVYTVWLLLFFLLPFDFTLGLNELRSRLVELPGLLLSFPNGDRPPSIRVLLVAADAVSTIPIGMLLGVIHRQRPLSFKLRHGLALMLAVEFMTLFVISAAPFAVAILYRMAGIAIGIMIMEWIKGKDLRRRHYALSRYLPVVFPVYAVSIVFVSGLFTRQWVTFDDAMNNLDMRQLAPFWNHYIVSKAQATKSLVVHAAMFAPIGVMVWIRRGFRGRGATISAILALGLSTAMELGRWFKPDLRPDFTNPLIALVAAAVAFKAMPLLWRMFEREANLSSPIDQHVAKLYRRVAEIPPAATG